MCHCYYLQFQEECNVCFLCTAGKKLQRPVRIKKHEDDPISLSPSHTPRVLSFGTEMLLQITEILSDRCERKMFSFSSSDFRKFPGKTTLLSRENG